MNVRKIVFLTGTRADFGKLKSLMLECENEDNFDVHIFITGMHMNSKYGSTHAEIKKLNFKNTYMFINHSDVSHMDKTLAKTIEGFSTYINEISPDLIIIHGDRLEALAGAIVGAFNNIRVAHIEGGEVSGTIDESIRHSVSKLSHFHFVSNEEAKNRLLQMGEIKDNIFVIGSPDLDIILNNKIKLQDVKKYYEIKFDEYAISIFHPVTTEFELIDKQSKDYFNALKDSFMNYIIIYPNNDYGSEIILNNIKKICNTDKFKIFPSIRFEYFSVLLKNANFIIGNSSTGVREAQYYPTLAINIGSRQNNRSQNQNIINTDNEYKNIISSIKNTKNTKLESLQKLEYGDGNSKDNFLKIIKEDNFWQKNIQKNFMERKIV